MTTRSNDTRRNHESQKSNTMHSGEREFEIGASRLVSRVSASGSRDFVESALNSESRALIRQGIFVITFVPITVTFISKLPDIILALTAALR